MSLEKGWNLTEMQKMDKETTHRPIEEEYSFYQAVKSGDMAFVGENCKTIAEITALHDDMALDFTGKMLELKKSSSISKPVMQCIDYIYSHINGRITVEDLADFTGFSATYLSRLFKKELGLSIGDYIREKKVEKAQNLLRYSDFSFIEISNYLAFSSQSHFIQLFDKYMGMTPKQYRDKYYRENW